MQISWQNQKTGEWSVEESSYLEISERMDECHVSCDIQTYGAILGGVKVTPHQGQYAFQLLSIRVSVEKNGHVHELVFIGTGGRDLGVMSFELLRTVQINGYTYFIAEEDDASFSIKLPNQDPGLGRDYHVEVRLLLLDDRYLASFRKYIVNAIRDTEQRLTKSEASLEQNHLLQRRIDSAENELQIIKSSRVWKIAEFTRKLVYEQTLSKFPRLQQRLLNWSRKPVRNSEGSSGISDLGTLRHNELNINPRDEAYAQYRQTLEQRKIGFVELATQISAFHKKPKFSIVMPVHNTPVAWLQEAVTSVLAQRYENFELCICDDGSTESQTLAYLAQLHHPAVRMVRSDKSGNISDATNKAIEMATGDFIAFMDHDDVLDEDALFFVCEAINGWDADLLYTDEDYISVDGQYHNPNFKPDYSPDLLLSHNYITHFLVVERELLDKSGLLNSEFDGCQDYDLVLRLTEHANTIIHVPKVLYHWRQSENSTSLRIASKPYIHERTKKMLVTMSQRREEEVEILNGNLPHFFYTRRRIKNDPSVSIIVPFRDEPLLLEKCLNSILSKSTWTEYEIVGVNNQSTSPLTFELMDTFSRNPRIRFIDYDEPFNFSAIVNFGVSQAYGDYIVLLNNDIQIITWDWIEAMLCHAQSSHCGVVGGKLLYPDNRIQHAGIIVGIDGYAGHGHKHFTCHAQGYLNRIQIVQNVAAVTGAFMMTNRSVYEEVGGFNENDFPVSCNDVDFCLRVLEAGYWNIYTPYAQAYHLESASRGYEFTEEKRKRFEQEKIAFKKLHGNFLELGDPFYNPSLTLENESFMIRNI